MGVLRETQDIPVKFLGRKLVLSSTPANSYIICTFVWMEKDLFCPLPPHISGPDHVLSAFQTSGFFTNLEPDQPGVCTVG